MGEPGPAAPCHDTVICVDSFPAGEGADRPRPPASRPALRPAVGGRSRRKRPQPHAFWKAAALALVTVVPAIALVVWLLAHVGVGNPDAGLIEVLRLTVVFAGPAAVLTAGGVGRLAAQAGAARDRRHAAWVGGRTLAVAGAGLVVLAAIPLDGLPEAWPGWTALLLAGALIGAAGGVLLGLVVGGPVPSLSELGVPEALQVDPLRALRRSRRPDGDRTQGPK